MRNLLHAQFEKNQLKSNLTEFQDNFYVLKTPLLIACKYYSNLLSTLIIVNNC